MQELFGNLWNLQWQQVVMWGIGGLLIWLAIKKEMEPSLLLPMGFGAILVNLPLSGAVTQVLSTGTEVGPLDVLFDAGIANELFPLLLFVGIAMAREKFSTLTEQMFYILLCLREECCGMDVMARVNELTGGRVAVGPGTLYNLLEQFLAAGYIVETRAEGRRRSYQLTAEGETLLQNEVERLQAQVRDYEKLFER